jgi:DNA-directed RNA polymerase specialized sigma24 family protein
MLEDGIHSSPPDKHEPHDEQQWRDLLVWLSSLVKMWMYSAHIITWYGQESEIAADIVQETATRAFAYIQSASRNEHAPVAHLNAFCRTTAYNVFVDRIRKERRMIHLPPDNDVYAIEATMCELADPEEIALDHLMLEEVIVDAARAIVNFPGKQKAALLIDLASATDFDASPSLVERALAEEGIHLRDYVRQPLEDSDERSRHASLLWHACQRLKREV